MSNILLKSRCRFYHLHCFAFFVLISDDTTIQRQESIFESQNVGWKYQNCTCKFHIFSFV